MSKTNKLPYFQINNTKETNKIAKFLLRKIKIQLKDKNHYHYLIFAKKYEYLNFIKENSKKYKYFLKIDIEKYYPCINHSILLDNMNSLPELNTRRMKRCVKKEIPQFLKQGPIIDKGLCIGNFLSWVLAGIYLLPLDYKIQRPFLRIQDDYLIFCKNQNEPQKILKELIEPELKKLELKINILKLKSGKFHQDKVNFLGFNFYAGYFTIYPVKCCSAAILPKAKLFNRVKKKFDLNKLGKNKKLAEKKQKKGYNNRTAKPPNLAQLEEIEYSPC